MAAQRRPPRGVVAVRKVIPTRPAGNPERTANPAVTRNAVRAVCFTSQGGIIEQRPTRSTVGGRAYLDLRKRAKADRRITAEYLKLYALEGFLLRLAQSEHRPRFVLKGGVLLAAYQLRPRRRDLQRLAWILFGLFWCEAIVGGISVKVQLAWFSVMGHFLLALALVSIALQMFVRAREATGRRVRIVTPLAGYLVRAVYLWTIGVVILGTLVTAAGPHGGDEKAKRLTIPITDLARTHGTAVDLLVILTLVTTVVLVRSHAPRRVINAASIAIGAMVAQGILGYVQYAKAIPSVLVGFHVFGAVVVFAAVQYLDLSTRAPDTNAPQSELRVQAPDADERAPTSAPVSATVGDPVA